MPQTSTANLHSKELCSPLTTIDPRDQLSIVPILFSFYLVSEVALITTCKFNQYNLFRAIWPNYNIRPLSSVIDMLRKLGRVFVFIPEYLPVSCSSKYTFLGENFHTISYWFRFDLNLPHSACRWTCAFLFTRSICSSKAPAITLRTLSCLQLNRLEFLATQPTFPYTGCFLLPNPSKSLSNPKFLSPHLAKFLTISRH